MCIRDRCNTRVVHFYASADRLPLLSYRSNPEGFYSLKNFAEAEFPASADALWTEHETLLFCTFRLADFAKGCFAPKRKLSLIHISTQRWPSAPACCMTSARR